MLVWSVFWHRYWEWIIFLELGRTLFSDVRFQYFPVAGYDLTLQTTANLSYNVPLSLNRAFVSEQKFRNARV